MFDLTYELRHISVLDHPQAPVFDRHPEATRREGTDEHQLLGILTDIDETAGASQARTKFAYIQVAFAVSLRKPEKWSTERRTVENAAWSAAGVVSVEDCLTIA